MFALSYVHLAATCEFLLNEDISFVLILPIFDKGKMEKYLSNINI
jgi:hypothetical protein